MAQHENLVSEETTISQLKTIISGSRPHFCTLPGYEGSSLGLYGRAMLCLDCDEVFPNLYVGDKNCAMNKTYLTHLGITHILNAAEGTFHGMVNTSAHYYSDVGINYLGIPLIDDPSCCISPYFACTAEFIDSGIKASGKVLIHCEKGYSRSPAVALSYLAIKVHMRLPMALRMCCSRRKICPNDGFLKQLSMLDNCLQCQSGGTEH